MYIRPPDRDAYARRARRRRSKRWRDRPFVILSAFLHVAFLLAFLLVKPETPPQPMPEPSASFEIVMNGGAPTPTSNGKPTPNAAPALTEGKPDSTPNAAPSAAPPPAPSAPPAPEPPAPPVPAEQQPVEAPTPPAPPQPAPQLPPSPAPPTPRPPPRVDLSSLPAPPPPVPLPEPPLPLPPLPPPPPRPRLLARPAPPREPRSASGFPTPQNWSFTGSQPSQASQQGALGHAETSGPSQPAPLITGAQLGRDWISAYRAWVQARLYYPEQAAENGEDGTAEVVLKINRYGRVESVELVGRSGSMWLDLAIQSLFRGRTVPPFPQGTKEDEATIDQTIQYILRRR